MLISYQRVDFFKTAEIRFIGEIRIELNGGFRLLTSYDYFYYDSKNNKPAKEKSKKLYYYIADKKNRIVHLNKCPYNSFDNELELRIEENFKNDLAGISAGFDNFFNEKFFTDQINGKNFKAGKV